MFSYYGSKSKIVHLYPSPKHDLLIEPFAGSARYALKYFDRDVVLVDRFEQVIRIWNFLKSASENDILSMPTPKQGDVIRREDFDCIEQAWLMGYLIQSGVNAARLTVTKMRDSGYINSQKRDIARQLFKIRHWRFVHGTYECLGNPEATWFVDPPYFQGGEYYRHPFNDFNSLKTWCEDRRGQTIVCENSAASWMPFIPLVKIHGSIKSSHEVFWTNEVVETQANLF